MTRRSVVRSLSHALVVVICVLTWSSDIFFETAMSFDDKEGGGVRSD